MLRLFVAALLLMLLGCATAAPPSAVRPNIYVMRHLHTPAGATDPGLTTEGQLHARRLADRLATDTPAAIYVSATRRAQQTAAPLAARLAITPKVYNPADTPGLVAAVLAEVGTVLVIGHSNTVPDIVERLGGPRPAALRHEDFGDLWHLSGPDRVTRRIKLGE